MRNSKTAPWHGEARKSGLHTKFRKRNLERFKVIKAINARRERSAQRHEQSGEYNGDAYLDA